MPRWDRADLHAQFKREARRPANDAEATEDRIDGWLTEAQDHWHRVLCTQFPQIHWNKAAVAMTSSDGGYTYAVAGVTQFIGPVRVRHNSPRGAVIPASDYILDAAAGTIRLPNSVAFGFTPYLHYAAQLDAIDSTPTEPSLLPDYARRLVVLRALVLFAEGGSGLRSPSHYLAMEQAAWLGRPELPGDLGILDALAHTYKGQPGEILENSGGSAVWYKGVPDFR